MLLYVINTLLYVIKIKFRSQFLEFTLYGVNGEMCINRENIVTREKSLDRSKVFLFTEGEIKK